jgi:hypothetical protein
MADIEACGEDRLYNRDTSNGARFSMAANYGWSDKTSIDIGGGMSIAMDSATQNLAK